MKKSQYLRDRERVAKIGRPKTDEEARLKCLDCENKVDQDQCKILGLITVETWHTCYLCGYAMVSQENTISSRRKAPRRPPSP